MDESPDLRVSYADRQAMIARLNAAFAEGRLTGAELEDRTMAAGRARTAGELAAVARDLPPVGSSLTPATGTSGSLAATWDGLARYRVLLIAPIICTIIYAVTDPGGYFWPVWVWLGCSIPILMAVLGRRG